MALGSDWCCRVIGECNCRFARRLITVGARWRWVAIGAAVLLGNVTADCQTPYNGGCKVALGSDWCWCVIGERNCRLLDALERWVQGGAG